MYITEVSIKRPVVAWVMSLILIIFGIFVFSELPVRELPDGIQPPVVQVQTDYKSASAEIVDEEIVELALISPTTLRSPTNSFVVPSVSRLVPLAYMLGVLPVIYKSLV